MATRNAATSRLREEIRLYETVLDALPQVGTLSFALLVNERNEVLRIIGSSKTFLKPLSGTIDVSLKNLLCDPLQLPVNSAMMKAFTQSKVVRMRGVNLQLDDGEDISVSISVLPIATHKTLTNHALITLEEEQKGAPIPDHILMDAEVEVRNRINNLENELQITRENLQSTIEEPDADLRIQSFSSDAVRVFNLIDKDEGHHINRISHHLGELDIEKIAGKVQQNGDNYLKQIEIPKLGNYKLMMGPVDHQEIGEPPGVAIVIQGPLD